MFFKGSNFYLQLTQIWLYSSMNCCYMFLRVATFIYKSYTDMTLFKHELMLQTFLRWIFIKHELLLHVFKGSNFYLQIIHWYGYDFIQAWIDVTDLFKVSLINFPHGEHLYGFINMESLKCSSTTLNLYHKHKRLNSSNNELSLDLLTMIFDCWIFISK